MSDLRIEFYAVVEFPSGEAVTVPLDSLTYEETVETDIFDEGIHEGNETSTDGSAGSDGSSDDENTSDDDTSGDDTSDDDTSGDDTSDDNTSDDDSEDDDGGLLPLTVDR